MNTQTHILMGAVLFGRSAPRMAWAGAAGGLVPDLPMYAIVAGLRLAGTPLSEIFGRLYWEHWWQVANAIGHSFVLWGGLFLVSFVARRGRGHMPAAISPAEGFAPLAFAFSGSALVHTIVDFLVHRDDAHMSFWPLSEWRFRSPVSYWDPAHYGQWFGLAEAALGVAFAVLLFRRFRNRAVRAALFLAILLYLAVPAFFIYGLSEPGAPQHQHGPIG